MSSGIVASLQLGRETWPGTHCDAAEGAEWRRVGWGRADDSKVVSRFFIVDHRREESLHLSLGVLEVELVIAVV